MTQRPKSPASHQEADVYLHTLAEGYCKHLRTTRLANHTQHSYTAAVRRFARSFSPTMTVSEVTPETVRRWFRQYEEGHNPNTVHQQAIGVRLFFTWAVESGYLLDSPVVNLDLPSRKNASRERLTQQQAQDLLSACDRIANESKRLKTRALLCVMLYGGLRRGSVLDLKLSDLFLKEGRLELRHTKCDKEQTVYLPKEAVQALRDWLHVRPQVSPHPYVFTHNALWRLSKEGLASLMKEVYAIAGIPYPKRPCHVLRGIVGTRLLINQADITQIQAALGHSRPETTFLYLRPEQAHLAKIAQMASFVLVPESSQDTVSEQKAQKAQKEQKHNEEFRRFAIKRLRR